MSIFFVLNGYHDGERGIKAQTRGGHSMKDGWYVINDDGEDTSGPYTDKEGAQEADKPEQTILGLKFRKMREADYHGLSGAPPCSYMHENDGAILIYDPFNQHVHEITDEGRSTKLWRR